MDVIATILPAVSVTKDLPISPRFTPYDFLSRCNVSSFFPFFVYYLEMSLFPSIFCTISALSLYGEYFVRSFLPNGVFLPCDHGVDF